MLKPPKSNIKIFMSMIVQFFSNIYSEQYRKLKNVHVYVHKITHNFTTFWFHLKKYFPGIKLNSRLLWFRKMDTQVSISIFLLAVSILFGSCVLDTSKVYISTCRACSHNFSLERLSAGIATTASEFSSQKNKLVQSSLHKAQQNHPTNYLPKAGKNNSITGDKPSILSNAYQKVCSFLKIPK